MFNRLGTRPRVVLLIAVQTLILIVAGLITVAGLRAADHNVMQLNRNHIEQVAVHQLNEALRTEVAAITNNAANETIAWDQAHMDVLTARNLMTSLWDEYQAGGAPQDIAELPNSLAKNYESLMLSFNRLENIFQNQDHAKLTSYEYPQLKALITAFIAGLNDELAQRQLQSDSIFEQSTSRYWTYLLSSIAVMLIGLAATSALGVYVYRSIQPEVSVAQTGQDNDRLDDALVELLHAISQLNGRDLTIKLPVNEDVAGCVAAAFNHHTSKTAQVLIDMRRIAEHVTKAAVMVRTQSDVVVALATNEHSEIDTAARALEHTATTLNQLAVLAQACGHAAEATHATTDGALHSAASTLENINTTRTALQETEAHVIRLETYLEDMSKAMAGMNALAERTRILALNADMHAALTGESSRSFIMVADEARRLAENTGEVRLQIETSVTNLHSASRSTVLTVHHALAQINAGRCFAELTGKQVAHHQTHTLHLINAVGELLQGAPDHIHLSTVLQGHAHTLQTSTRKSHEQMQEQVQHTKRLVQYSKVLMSAVQVFTLPGDDEELSPPQNISSDVPLKMRAS